MLMRKDIKRAEMIKENKLLELSPKENTIRLKKPISHKYEYIFDLRFDEAVKEFFKKIPSARADNYVDFILLYCRLHEDK